MAEGTPPDGPSQPVPTGVGDDPRARRFRGRFVSARARGNDLARTARRRFDLERERRSWLETIWGALQRMQRRGGPLLSGGLAYRVFLWELPMSLTIVAVLGLFVDLGARSPDQVAREMGLSAALAATVAQAVAQTDSSSWWLLLVGLWLTWWTARSAVSALRLIHRIAWDQESLPKTRRFLAPVVFSAMLLGVLLASLAVGRLPGGGMVVSALAWVAVLAASFAFVVLAMSLLPRAGRPWSAVLPGAAIFTIITRGIAIASGVYFTDKLDRVEDFYGSLGVAIVVLVWLYLLAWGWIAATFINAGFQGVAGGRPVAEPEPRAPSDADG